MTPATLDALIGRAVGLLPAAIAATGAPGWLAEGAAGIASLLAPELTRRLRASLATEPLPELLATVPPDDVAAVLAELRALGIKVGAGLPDAGAGFDPSEAPTTNQKGTDP